MKTLILSALAVIMILVAGCVSNSTNATDSMMKKDTMEKSGEMMEKSGEMMEKSGETMMKKEEGAMMEKSGETMMKKEEGAMMEKSGETMIKYTGKIFAGTSSPLIDFNKPDYDTALTTGKTIVLYFYADWCPICRAEVPILESAFNELTTDKIIGFRVNFNDGQTDANEVAIARQFGVAYQHTKVFLKNGQAILKSPETWDKSRYLNEINRVVG